MHLLYFLLMQDSNWRFTLEKWGANFFKEEHDAKTLGSGMLLKSYIIYPDGNFEEVE